MNIFFLPKSTYERLPDTVFTGVACPEVQSLREHYIEEPTIREFDLDSGLVEALLKTAVAKYGDDNNALDQWLAPRLHSAVRAPRRIAGDTRFWAWLAVEHGHVYIQSRWERSDGVHRGRYTGELLRNGLSRLWWGAEMVRNGPSYDTVSLMFSRVRTAQFALELKYSWFRPAAIAFTRVGEGVGGAKALTDDEMKSLSKTINAYLSLTALEGYAAAGAPNEEFDSAWWRSSPSLTELLEREPEGPTDGIADESLVSELETWFRSLLSSDLPG